MGAGRASLIELQTVYGLEDVYDLMEVSIVGSENERRAHEAARED
ncbi:transcription elongation factor GreA [Novosphingobium sp. THN1]|nr:transcription elongation factor GreA [Novosphingobium sp. THN1]